MVRGLGAQVNDPQYLIAVVIEKGGYGASAAAPVAEAGFSYLVANPVAPVNLSPPRPGRGPASSTTTSTRRPRSTTARPARSDVVDQTSEAAARTGGAEGPRTGPGRPGAGSRLGGHMTSLWPRIEPLLAHVTKPARYIGGELGACEPDHGPGRVAWLLLYPDTYEIGLPNQGLQILYEILNERPDAVAERAYAPWTDMEAAMRAAGVPLFSVETSRPAADFDILAFNLSAELTYTNVLNLIDLAGVPVRAADRSAGAPARDRRRPLRLQPRADGRFRRRLRAR